VLKPFCKDKNSDACYINYSKLPPEFPRPKECNPLTNYDFYESSYLSNLLILIALGIFYRIFAIIAVYRFCKENKENNDPIPDELVSAVKKRRQALSEGSNSSAAESPVVRVDENRVYPKDASERFLVAKKVVDDGRLQAHPPLYQNCASYQSLQLDPENKIIFTEQEHIELKIIKDNPNGLCILPKIDQ
jgi:hypothetical protein